jgi:hypothetical protein
MASVETVLNRCTVFVAHIDGESGENKCCIMIENIELLVSELKSSQLIIKILQEVIKSTTNSPRNQDNLTNAAEHETDDDFYTTSNKNSTWKWKVNRRTIVMAKGHSHSER